jgi:hypothetical protein
MPAAFRDQLRQVPTWQPWVAGLNFLASVWNTVELFFFKRRARPIYVAILIIGFLTSLWGPYLVEHPLAVVWAFLQCVAAGAVVTAMYASSVASRFASNGAAAA